MAKVEEWDIIAHYMIPGTGWTKSHNPVTGTMREAGYAASQIARTMDNEYGNDHFWTVDIVLADRPTESFIQLFHGRLDA